MAKINESTLREEIFQKYNFRVLNPRCNAASRFTDYMESVFKAFSKLEQWADITRFETPWEKLDYLTRVLIRIERYEQSRMEKMRLNGKTLAQLPYTEVIQKIIDKVTVLDAMLITLEWVRFREDSRRLVNQVKEQSRALETNTSVYEKRVKRGNEALDSLRERVDRHRVSVSESQKAIERVMEEISVVRRQILADEIELKILRSESGLNQG